MGGLLRLGDLDLPFPPDLLRLRGGVLRRGEDRLPRGDGDLRRPRGEGERRRRGEGDLRRAGDRRLGEGRRASLRGSSTGAAVISCPSICPPSMCFIAFWASSALEYSMYANPLLIQGLLLSFPKSISLILPNVAKISSRCCFMTFLVRRPM